MRFLDNLYQSNGARTRLAAQGNGAAAQLYELKEGTDTAFVTASGGSGLGGTSQNMFQGVTLGDAFYLTDRVAGLLKYRPAPASGNHLIPVTQPTAPANAPGAQPRPWQLLEDWTSPSWIDSSGNFVDTDDTATQPPPTGGKTRKLDAVNNSARSQTITKPTGAGPLFAGDPGINSHTLAFWLRQDHFTLLVAWQMGLTQATDFATNLSADSQNVNTWYPFFVELGSLQSLNYLRFQCVDGGGAVVWVSALTLPGNLDGPYQWRYTYYDSVNSRESAPSPPSNGGVAMDFSLVGTSFAANQGAAFNKTCALKWTPDGFGTTDRVRVYRNGGVDSLTVDENGTALWLRVADLPAYASTFNMTDSAGATLLHFATVPASLQPGMWLVLDPDVVGKEEYVQISGVSAGTPGTVNIARGLGANGTTLYTHNSGAVVRIAFVDNTANEAIQLTETLDIERGNPPAGARFVARSPEGRLWLFNYTGSPTGIAISNKPTPDRPKDYECFPAGVDPITRRSQTQGFQIQLSGDVTEDEEIVWGGFFHGWPHFLTRTGLYRINAQSQYEWQPTAIQRLHRVGCIAGDTVVESRGVLYWVADGPRVMSWDGSSQPVPLSDRRYNVHLAAAPSATWGQWFGKAHTKVDGDYYCLYYTPQGQTLNTTRLDYNITRDAFEPVVYYDANANPIAYQAAAVRGGSVDTPDLYQADSTGKIDQAEIGNLDRGQPIRIRLTSYRYPGRASHPYWESFLKSSLLHTVWIRASPTGDTLTATLTSGGNEYLTNTASYPVPLTGTGEEVKIRAARTLQGRWFQVQITGATTGRPSIRDLVLYYIPVRLQRTSP